MDLASISWVLWKGTFTKAMRVATLVDNKRDIILNEIAPTLRVAEPGKVPNCEEIQQKYEVKRRKHIDSTAEKIVIQTADNQPEPSAPILTPTSLCHVEQNTELYHSLYPDIPLSVAAGGAETSQLTTLVPPNQSVSAAGTGLQQNEIKDFVINILEDRYAAAKNDLILQLRAEVTRAEEKWNERLLIMFQNAMHLNDKKYGDMMVQLREDTLKIEQRLIEISNLKALDAPPTCPTSERIIKYLNETASAGAADDNNDALLATTYPSDKSNKIKIQQPGINGENIRVSVVLFYFGEGFSLPTSLSIVDDDAIDELLPANFKKIVSSYFDDILRDVATNESEVSRFSVAPFIIAPICIILYVVLLVMGIVVDEIRPIRKEIYIFGTVFTFFPLFWLVWRAHVHSKKKRTVERAVFERLDACCEQLTDSSAQLFRKQIKIQMVKSFDHKSSTMKTAQIYKINDLRGSCILTPVYFLVSLDVVQHGTKPEEKMKVSSALVSHH